MMTWFSKINPVDITEKNRRIEQLERELIAANGALKDMIDASRNESRSATFCFDFKAVKAFSVERNIDGKLPVTIIGYMLPVVSDGKETFAVKEWYLHCDEKQHEAVVKAFKESVK
jgi:hypothetical protein